MDIKAYTDEKYIPISQMKAFDEDFINKTIAYRQSFMEMIQLDDLHFVNLVETPSLIKKRFIANIKIKNFVPDSFISEDYILDLAKAYVKKEVIQGIKFVDDKKLLEIYLTNENDLTIVTNYIAENIFNNHFMIWENREDNNIDIQMLIPELSNFEKAFIQKYHIKTHNYTLHDFQELNKTSYETARKSLDKLKQLKLYIKNKVGKKYVYSPTQKLIHILNGGA